MTPRDFHVMIDLETLGTGPEAMISELGAVAFQKQAGGEVFTKTGFHRHVKLHDQFRSIDISTLLWFIAQSEALHQRFLEGQRRAAELDEVRRALNMWFHDNCGLSKQAYRLAGVWAKPSEFDLAILSNVYGGPAQRPWDRKLSRDMKTFLEEHAPLQEERWGHEHDAFHDACTQARHMIRVLTAEETARPAFLDRELPLVSVQPVNRLARGKCLHDREVCIYCRPVGEYCSHQIVHCQDCVELHRKAGQLPGVTLGEPQ